MKLPVPRGWSFSLASSATPTLGRSHASPGLASTGERSSPWWPLREWSGPRPPITPLLLPPTPVSGTAHRVASLAEVRASPARDFPPPTTPRDGQSRKPVTAADTAAKRREPSPTCTPASAHEGRPTGHARELRIVSKTSLLERHRAPHRASAVHKACARPKGVVVPHPAARGAAHRKGLRFPEAPPVPGIGDWLLIVPARIPCCPHPSRLLRPDLESSLRCCVPGSGRAG